MRQKPENPEKSVFHEADPKARAPSSGNTLILAFTTWNSNDTCVQSVNQTSVTWSLVVKSDHALTGSWHQVTEIWKGMVGASASKDVYVYWQAADAPYGTIGNIAEYSGSPTTDATASDWSTTTTSVTTGNIVTTHPDELVVARVGATGGGNVTQYSPLNGFSQSFGAYVRALIPFHSQFRVSSN